jgi:hypothetical protein
MILVRRWADRRRIQKLKQSWEAFRAMCELEMVAQTAAAESSSPAGGAENGAALDKSENGYPVTSYAAHARQAIGATAGASLEGRFLRIKADTARLLPVLSEVVGRRAIEQEADAAERGMTELLNRVPSLADLQRLSPAEQETILRDWHVLYLFLSKLEGAMTGSAINGTALRAPADWTRRDARAGRSRLGGLASFGLEAAIVLGFIMLAAAMLGIDFAQVRRLGTAAIGRTPTRTAPTVAGADVSQTPTGETEVTASSAAPDFSSTPTSAPPVSGAAGASAPAIGPAPRPAPVTRAEQAFPLRMPRVVQPVLLRYGTVGTYLLAGAFVCGIALLFGLRSRT